MTVSDSVQKPGADSGQGPRAMVSWRAGVMTGPQSFLEARVVNISADGIGLLCDQAYAAGTKLQVAVAIPDPKDRSHYHYVTLQLKVGFHVSAGSKFRTGTSIVHVDPATKQMIDHWLSKG